MKKIFKFSLLFSLISLSFLMAQISFAQNESTAIVSTTDKYSTIFRSSAGFSGAVETPDLIASIIKTALSFLGVIFIVLMVLSGYQWLTAGGNEDAIKKAKSRIINAIIGLAIVILAYSITAFVFKNLPGGNEAEQVHESSGN